jgi:hypothetical protein
MTNSKPTPKAKRNATKPEPGVTQLKRNVAALKRDNAKLRWWIHRLAEAAKKSPSVSRPLGTDSARYLAESEFYACVERVLFETKAD